MKNQATVGAFKAYVKDAIAVAERESVKPPAPRAAKTLRRVRKVVPMIRQGQGLNDRCR